MSGTTAPTWNTDGGLHVFAGNTYTYDALQRLTEVDYSGGKTLFSYDPLGRRVKKVDENSSGTVLSTFGYHYDGSEVGVEYQPGTTWTYYLGLGLDQVVLRDSGSTKQWYYRDGHGSTSAVVDNSGNPLEEYEYNAQGQFQIANAGGTVESTTQIANDLLYTGRNYDYETGNYFYRARYYNPQLGRFISRDPLSGAEFSQGTNLYTYCLNSCLIGMDPSGMVNYSMMAMGAAQMAGAAAGFVLMGASDTAAEVFTGGAATPAVVGLSIAGGTALSGLGATGFANFVGSFVPGAQTVSPPTSLPGIAADAVGTQLGGKAWGDAAGAGGDLLTSAFGAGNAAAEFVNTPTGANIFNSYIGIVDVYNSTEQFKSAVNAADPSAKLESDPILTFNLKNKS